MGRQRESREVWVKRIERLGDSPLSMPKFAAELGINVHTLRYWKQKLREEERGAGDKPAIHRPKPHASGSPPPLFTGLDVSVESQRHPSVEVLLPSGIVLRLHEPCAHGELASLICALESPP